MLATLMVKMTDQSVPDVCVSLDQEQVNFLAIVLGDMDPTRCDSRMLTELLTNFRQLRYLTDTKNMR